MSELFPLLAVVVAWIPIAAFMTWVFDRRHSNGNNHISSNSTNDERRTRARISRA